MEGGGLRCLVGLHFHSEPLCSHAPPAPGRARFQLCSGAKASTGAGAGWTTLMALSHAGIREPLSF